MTTTFGARPGPLRGFARIEMRPVSRTTVVSSWDVLLEVRGLKSVRGIASRHGIPPRPESKTLQVQRRAAEFIDIQ